MDEISNIQIKGTNDEVKNYKIKDETAREQIQNILNSKIPFPNFYVGVFYTGGLDGTDIKHPIFKCSLDGKHFTTFNINNNIIDNYFTDPCLAFDETTKTFMISYTSYDDDRDCIILTSKDFVNWTEHKINLGYMQPHSNLHRWAPKLFVDDNDEETIYLTLSLEYKKDSHNNPIFKQVLFKCTNKENLTFINIGDILLQNNTAEGYIDGYIAKNNGIYYFVVKKDNYDTDNTGVIQLYTTTDIEQTNYYGLVNNYVNFEGLRVEAPTLLFQNNKVNFYAEIYSFSHGGYIMQQDYISNLPNISKKAESLKTLKYNDDADFNSKNKYDARAGNILYLQSNTAKQIILNNTDISFSDTSLPTIENAQFDYISMYPAGYSGSVVAFPDLAYGMKFSGSDIIIPNLINPFSLRRLKFILGNTAQKITIQKLNGEDVNIIFNNKGYSNNNVVYFDFNKKQFVNNNESIGSSDLIGNNGDVKITWLSDIKQNGLVMLDIIFTVQTPNSGEITVATLPEGYKPANFVQIANKNNIDLYITNSGEIKGAFANMQANNTLRVNVIYLINNP